MFECFSSTQTPTSASKKLFLFDVDGTLVVSKSGRKWADSEKDWVWTSEFVPALLAMKATEGFQIALVSNQSAWLNTASKMPGKIGSILGALEVTNGWKPWCLVATAKPKQKDLMYRKPGRGLYDILLGKLGWVSEEVEELYMCGDAVGPQDPHPAYRWADSDLQFAKTIGATFLTPCDIIPKPTALEPTLEKEIVILVGNPGSGKSTAARSLSSAGYKHVEQDVTKTAVRTMRLVREAIHTQSVVVDATHAAQKHRAPYIRLAQELGCSVRIVWCLRDGRPFNALREKPVPEIAYAMYSKYFEEPIETEAKVARV